MIQGTNRPGLGYSYKTQCAKAKVTNKRCACSALVRVCSDVLVAFLHFEIHVQLYQNKEKPLKRQGRLGLAVRQLKMAC